MVFTGVVSSDIISEDLLQEYQLFLDVLRRISSAPPHIQRIRDSTVQHRIVPHWLVSVSLIPVWLIAATYRNERTVGWSVLFISAVPRYANTAVILLQKSQIMGSFVVLVLASVAVRCSN